ncbi:MAG: trypsin-like peptidase domain-containing protein [Oscillospiraceae bacterium]|nr:trypsin-like peptidase domain-containing protein [Oscillospiraceae bacterium]
MTEEELKALLDNAALSEEPHPEQSAESDALIEDIKGFFDGPRVLPQQPVPEEQPAGEPSFIPDPENPLPAREQTEPMPFAGYPEEKPQKHGWIAAVFAVTVLLLIGFAVFCIVMDLRSGTTVGGYRAGDVIEVKLEQHDKPASAKTDVAEHSAAGVAKKVMPSIVQIYTYSNGAVNGTGSGIILTEDGYIATNAHVVKDAEGYTVKLFDEGQSDKTYDAVLIGHDSKTDLAVLKISLSGLHPAELGNSDQVQLGETVCALGNPAGLSGSITVGIISGMNRKVRANAKEFEMDCFQTDAAISPGNSGGALVNLSGQVIGITSSKYGRSILTGAGYEGLGFAIMINEAMPIIKELMEQGYVSGRVRIGIEFYENAIAHQKAAAEEVTLPPQLDGTGIQIGGIAEDTDLANTVLKPGEWILAMNGKEVSDYDSVNKAIEGLSAGDTVHCRCARIKDDGRLETFEIDFKLMEDQSGEF